MEVPQEIKQWNYYIILLPVQHPWVSYFKRLKLKTSEFGTRKSLLLKKESTEKMGDLVLKYSLRKCEVQSSFMSTKGKWEGQEVADDHRHQGASRFQGRFCTRFL